MERKSKTETKRTERKIHYFKHMSKRSGKSTKQKKKTQSLFIHKLALFIFLCLFSRSRIVKINLYRLKMNPKKSRNKRKINPRGIIKP